MLDFEPDPRDRVVASDALKTPEDMQELLNSTYDVSANAYYGRQQNLAELLSDNLNPPNTHDDYNEVYIRNTIFFNGTIGTFYAEPYIAISRANVLLENFDLIAGLTPEDRLRIEAEARFIRAISHFELVNLFGQPFEPNEANSQLGIVIKNNSDVTPVPRATVAQVYDFILEDLLFAQENLPIENGLFVDRSGAEAMLARVYFQMNDFENAAGFASLVINSGKFTIDTDSLSDFESKYNRWSADIASENILTLIVFQSDGRSNEFSNYRSDNVALPTLVAASDYYNELYGAGSDGNPNDLRKNWFEIRQAGTPVEFYAVTKFNMDFFNIPYLHLTEILLIRAESLAEMGTDIGTAIADINLLRSRALISPLSDGSSTSDIINNARIERKKEMFAEGRWVLDQKRQGAKNDLEDIRGVSYDCKGMVLQFPVSENVSNFIPNPTGGCN